MNSQMPHDQGPGKKVHMGIGESRKHRPAHGIDGLGMGMIEGKLYTGSDVKDTGGVENPVIRAGQQRIHDMVIRMVEQMTPLFPFRLIMFVLKSH